MNTLALAILMMLQQAKPCQAGADGVQWSVPCKQPAKQQGAAKKPICVTADGNSHTLCEKLTPNDEGWRPEPQTTLQMKLQLKPVTCAPGYHFVVGGVNYYTCESDNPITLGKEQLSSNITIYTPPVIDPFDVPPIEEHVRRAKITTCADKSRFLMTDESGVKHCIALVPRKDAK